MITSLNHNTEENDVINYINKGINEFYFGFMPKQWVQKYGWEICTNRRPYPINPHITDWQKAQRLIETVHKKKKKIYLALNEHKYTYQQYQLLVPMLKKFINFNIDGILVADIAFISYIKDNDYKIPIHLSIGGGIFNIETVKFFHKLGVERIILPRKLNLQEIKQIIDASPKKITFEVFLLGEWCRYNDAYCFNVHGYGKNEFCKSPKLELANKIMTHHFLKEKVNYPWCGLCLMSYLKDYYSRILFKIPLRSDMFNDKLLIEEVVPLIKKGNFNNETLQKHLQCDKRFCAYELT